MKQQKEKVRDANESDHFHFNQELYQNYGGRTGQYYGDINTKKRKDGYARWSDYITYDSNQLQTGQEQEDQSLYLRRVSEGGPDQNMVGKQIPHQQSNIAEKQEKNIPQESPKQDQQELPPPTIAQPNQPISESRTHFQQASSSPFIVSNISQIKQRQTSSLNPRSSERFLLELLQSQKSKLAAKKQQEELQRQYLAKQKEQERRKEKDKKTNEGRDKNEKKENSKVSQMQSRRITERRKEANSRKSIVVKQKQINPKQKRVTINDRGKIKLPSDSISGDFQYFLPSEFRTYLSSTKKQPEQAEQLSKEPQTSEYQPIIKNNQEQPMDIIAPQSQHLEVIEEKEDQEIINIQNKEPSNNKATSKVGRKNSKKQSLKNKNSKEKKSSSLRKIVVHNQQQSQKQEPERKKVKMRKNDDHIIETHSSLNTLESNSSRPKRHRTKPLQYWRNQKPVYSKEGIILGISSLSGYQFLTMLGFQNCENIHIESKVHFTSKKIDGEITIPPKQAYYSVGFNSDKIGKVISSPKYFTQLIINCSDHINNSRSWLKIIVDEWKEIQLDEEAIITADQTFSIQNISKSKPCVIELILSNDQKKQRKP